MYATGYQNFAKSEVYDWLPACTVQALTGLLWAGWEGEPVSVTLE